MTMPFLFGAAATVRASVKVGSPMGLPMRPDVERLLTRVVVDTHLHLPDMFELTFLDEEGHAAKDANLSIGTGVEIFGGAPDSMESKSLIKGEVTSIEAICVDGQIRSVVRGYEKAHRLQRARRSLILLMLCTTSRGSLRQKTEEPGWLARLCSVRTASAMMRLHH